MDITQPANNVTGSALLNLARRARERRNDILQEIITFEPSDAAVQFSNPSFYTKLLFPFVGPVLPTRFTLDKEDKWFYMGRERFTELLYSLQDEEWRNKRSALWLYGTRGYGKSHLLA